MKLTINIVIVSRKFFKYFKIVPVYNFLSMIWGAPLSLFPPPPAPGTFIDNWKNYIFSFNLCWKVNFINTIYDCRNHKYESSERERQLRIKEAEIQKRLLEEKVNLGLSCFLKSEHIIIGGVISLAIV